MIISLFLVQTEVVRGNIPVKNGVVHLISKPLVVIDSTVYDTMAVSQFVILIALNRS